MRANSDYRAEAREALSGRWNETALMSLIIFACSLLFSGVSMYDAVAGEGVVPMKWVGMSDALNTLVIFLMAGPLEFAMFNVLLQMKRGDLADTPMMSMFRFFSKDWARYVVAYVLMTVIVVLISIPTLCIGGIIFAYAYKMVPYLLHDYPELSAKEALKLSREMMKGYKWDLFLLDFSFIGWALLAILTLGIGLLWLMPYIYAAEAGFYEDLKAETVVEE